MPISVIVVGGGKVGAYLATMLLSSNHRVQLIEASGDRVVSLQHDLPPGVVLQGSGSDPSVLEAAGIRQANVVAAVTGDDETNLVVTSLARFEFNVARTIARVNNPRNAWLYTPEMGVDVALNQAELMGHLIVEEMSVGDMMTLLKLRKGQYSLVEERVDASAFAVGRAVRDLQLPTDCNLIAVIRSGQLLIAQGGLVLQPEDEVIALADSSRLATLASRLSKADAA